MQDLKMQDLKMKEHRNRTGKWRKWVNYYNREVFYLSTVTEHT